MLEFKNLKSDGNNKEFEGMLKDNYKEIYHEEDKAPKNKAANAINKVLKMPKSMLLSHIEAANEDIEELFGENPKFGTIGFEIITDGKKVGYILLDIAIDNKKISHGSIYSLYIKPEERRSFYQNPNNIDELNKFVDDYFAKLGITNLEYSIPTVMWNEDLADAINQMGYTPLEQQELDTIPFIKKLDLEKEPKQKGK